MSATSQTERCCPPFDPEPWNEKDVTWQDKKFVQDRVRSLFHIPMNFPGVMKRNVEQIQKADAVCDPMIVLADENSLWGADVYIDVSKDVPNTKMATISGTFLTKVFEGPYRNIKQWAEQMKAHVAAQGKDLKKIYFYYTTCPKCSKAYGKNYVVLLAQV